jgi:hypothetical protein
MADGFFLLSAEEPPLALVPRPISPDFVEGENGMLTASSCWLIADG